MRLTIYLLWFLLCGLFACFADPLATYAPEQHVRYLDDPAAGYTRIDYQWYLRNTGQTSYCFQNGLIVPSLTETGGQADAGIMAAWAQQPSAEGVIVAIIDSGCNDNNAELSGVVLKGYHVDDRNLIYNETDYSDYDGHGTAIASIVAAKHDGNGMAGVAPGVQLLIVQTRYATSEITKGINWSIANGADIICLSWGETDVVDANLRPLMAACLNAQDHAVLIVSAVGYGRNLDVSPTYPYAWNLPNYVAVAGTTRTGGIFAPSSIGRRCVGAPARVIVQLGINGQPGYSSGNSFASPIVAGILALMIAHNPGELPRKHISQLKHRAARQPVTGIIGRVNGAHL